MKQFRIAIFASGSGTNADEILKYFQQHPSIEVVLLLSNNPQAFALERAKKYNVPVLVFTRSQLRETEEVITWLKENQIKNEYQAQIISAVACTGLAILLSTLSYYFFEARFLRLKNNLSSLK